MTEALAYGYSSESTQRELSNDYQYDRFWMVFKNLCMFVLWMKVASALEKRVNKIRNYLCENHIFIKWLSDTNQ